MSITLSMARRMGSVLTAAVGFMNIVSALYPAVPARMELLRDLLPLNSIRGTQTATVLAGFFLVLLADGLRKRRARALQLTVALLLLSGVLNLAKGLDFEEATITTCLSGFLFYWRRAYDVPSRVPVASRLLQRLSTFALLYFGYALAGFLILRNVIDPFPTVRGVVLEPFRLLVGAPTYRYITPQAQWFGRSLAFVGSAAILSALYALLRPFIQRPSVTPEEVTRVRTIVRRYGMDSLSYFSLQDGRSYFFHPQGEAFLSYRLWGNVALVGGDPIGDPRLIPSLIQSFLEFARDSAIDPCFLGVSGTHLHLYEAVGLRSLKIGEEAIIDLPNFAASELKRKVRRAVRHAEDLGIYTQMFSCADIPTQVLTQMEEISRQWVESKGGTERGFSMTLGRLPRAGDDGCEVAVAMAEDRVCGYLVFVPVYGVNGWSLDSMRRRHDSPNGLMEHLVVRAAEGFQARGYATLSLNFATLSNSEDDIASRAIEGTRRFLFENLSGFYQLKSLCQFNSKFAPRWQSRYMAYGDVLKFPKVALAIVQSEDPVKLPSLAGVFRR